MSSPWITALRPGGRLLVGVPAAALLAACNRGVLDPAGPVGAAEKTILLNSLGIMLAVVVPTIVATLVIAFWFRAGNRRAKYRPDWTFSGQIELVVWAIPAMVVLLLGGIAWVGSHDLEPSKPLDSATKALSVEVISLDWKWLFIYPEQGVASVNRLVIPAGTPIAFRLTSASVMNSFFVPQLGSQIYTMAGMATRLQLQADRPGRYQGLSVQYSGEGFSDMQFTVEALPATGFEIWIAETRGHGDSLDARGYERLARRSKAVPPQSYGAVSRGLFDTVLHETMQGAAPPASKPAAPDGAHTEG